MTSGSTKRPQRSEGQPASSRLSRRVMKKTIPQPSTNASRKQLPKRDKFGRFIKASKKQLKKRDKYGRFTKTARLQWLKRQQSPARDKNGRFISRTKQRLIKRDRYGRFTKKTPVWYQRRTAIYLPFIVFGITSIFYFGWQLNKTIAIEDPIATGSIPAPNPTPVKSNQPEVLPRSEPTRLRISKIGIDASFTPLGQKANGTMQIPTRYDIVGWYNKAPTPGELGPAIVVGHIDRPGGIAVFWRLRELIPGDTFEIDRVDGKTVKFKVDAVKQLPQDNFPTEEVYGNIDYAGIRLITCGGTFNRKIQRYSHNTVVYGSMVVEKKAPGSN